MKSILSNKHSILFKITKLSFVFILLFSITLPVTLVKASNTTVSVKTSIDNPLGEKLTDIPSFVKKAIEIVLTVGVPVVVLAIIYTGFLFVQAQGNKSKLDKAKSSLTNTLIGAALLLGAFVIAEAIGSTVEEIRSNV